VVNPNVTPSIRRSFRRAVFVTAVLLGGAHAAQAQSATTPAVERDPAVLARLTQMGDYLRSLKSFVVKAETAKDEVLQSGQKLQFAGTVEYRYARPDKLRVTVKTDRKWREFYFDGKTLTQAAPRMGYYGSLEMPGKPGELMSDLAQRYGIDMPLADLFYWGTPASGVEDITSASLIGPARVGGIDCDHYALRQPGVDWQIWIERGAKPLPRRIVITTTDEVEQPQFSATLGWDLGAQTSASAFTYMPPKGAKRITMKPAATAN
jgi:hypothetical protein